MDIYADLVYTVLWVCQQESLLLLLYMKYRVSHQNSRPLKQKVRKKTWNQIDIQSFKTQVVDNVADVKETVGQFKTLFLMMTVFLGWFTERSLPIAHQFIIVGLQDRIDCTENLSNLYQRPQTVFMFDND